MNMKIIERDGKFYWTDDLCDREVGPHASRSDAQYDYDLELWMEDDSNEFQDREDAANQMDYERSKK